VLHRINKAQPAIWKDPNTIQIGLGPNSVVLPELSAQQEKIIAALYSGLVEGQQEVIDSTVDAEPGETQNLIERLQQLVEQPVTGISPFGDWQQLAFAEIARASLDYQVNGEMVLAERWQRSVHIDQLDKAGMLLTKALLASGVGSVITHDDGIVLGEDLGELGFPKFQINNKRFESLQRELSNLSLPVTKKPRLIALNYKPDKTLKVSFALIMGHLALRPTTYSRWLNRDVNHLAITFNLDCVEVSPVVIPGVTPCLNCFQEYKVDEDSSWPVMASQLVDLPRVRDDSAALLTAVGLATRSVLRSIDEAAGFVHTGDAQAEIRNGYRVDYATGTVTRTSYQVHRLCTCQEPKLDLGID
jgi:hypothetical protein